MKLWLHHAQGQTEGKFQMFSRDCVTTIQANCMQVLYDNVELHQHHMNELSAAWSELPQRRTYPLSHNSSCFVSLIHTYTLLGKKVFHFLVQKPVSRIQVPPVSLKDYSIVSLCNVGAKSSILSSILSSNHSSRT